MSFTDDDWLSDESVSVGLVDRFTSNGNAIVDSPDGEFILGNMNKSAEGELVWFKRITDIHGMCIEKDHIPDDYTDSHIVDSIQDHSGSKSNPVRDKFGTKNDLLNKKF